MLAPRPISEVKGLWFVVGRRYVREQYGPRVLDECRAMLGKRHGAVFAEALPSQWYSEEALQQTLAVLDLVVAHGDPGVYVKLVEDCSLVAVHHFFRTLLRLVPPATMLRKIPTMWTLIRRGVGRVVVDAGKGHATIFYSEFPYFDDVHYRLLTVGAIRALMTLCDAKGTRVAVVEHSQDTLTVHVTWQHE